MYILIHYVANTTDCFIFPFCAKNDEKSRENQKKDREDIPAADS